MCPRYEGKPTVPVRSPNRKPRPDTTDRGRPVNQTARRRAVVVGFVGILVRETAVLAITFALFLRFLQVRGLVDALRSGGQGRVEPPTFRFSGARITVQDWPRQSPCLLSDQPCTSMDPAVRGCMRLGMRLSWNPPGPEMVAAVAV